MRVYEIYTQQRAWPRQVIFRAAETTRGFQQALGARHVLSYLLGEAAKGGPGGIGLPAEDPPLIPGPQAVEVSDQLPLIGIDSLEGPRLPGPFHLTVHWDRLPGGYTWVYSGDMRTDWNVEAALGGMSVAYILMATFQAMGRAPQYSIAMEVGQDQADF